MGDVISISRVSDVDIFSQFKAECPEIPEEIDNRIPKSARKAVAHQPPATRSHQFRNHCVFVVVLSILVLAAVKFISSAVAEQVSFNRFESGVGGIGSEVDTTYRNNRDAWLVHIKTLESHPVYERIVEEKRLYALHFTD